MKGEPPTRIQETPDLYGAFPRLGDEQIEALAPYGERRSTEAGQVLYREGDRNCEFFVILDGAVAIVDGYGLEPRMIGLHGPGRFLGELSLLSGQAAFLTAEVREPGEVLALPVDRLRRIVADDPTFGDLILRAFLIRRSVLLELGAGLRIVGSRFSPESRRLREFAARNRLPHRWIDLDADEGAEALVRELGVSPEDTPIVIWRGTDVLRNPSNEALARLIGLAAPEPSQAVCDLIVVGAGPAGLAAAVYGASEGLATVVLDAVAPGGQAGTSPRIENYLGFPSGLPGSELAERALLQAKKFGARLGVPARATALERDDGHHVVRLEDGSAVTGRSVVIATGARYRRLPVPRLEEFEGTGVHYAATAVEAQLCGGAPVAVVGGGNSAGQAALFLARHAAKVTLLVRGADLGENMSRYLVDRVMRAPGVEVVLNTEVRELVGEGGELEAIVVQDYQTGNVRGIDSRMLFVFIGVEPHAGWLGDEVALDDRGFVLTGPDAARATNGAARERWRPTLPLETSRPGVFAAGDVRSGSVKRVAAAVGDGAMAVRMVHEHLKEFGGPEGQPTDG